MSDETALASLIDDVLAAHPEEVGRFQAGEKKLQGFFVGRVMAATKGRANPPTVNAAVKRLMQERK